MNPSSPPSPDFVKAARDIGMRALKDVAPEEEGLAFELLEPLIESARKGTPLSLDLSEESGRFGVGDWQTFLLAPLVVDALQRRQQGEPGAITAETVQASAKHLGTERTHKEAAAIAAALTAALSEQTASDRSGEGPPVASTGSPQLDPFAFSPETRGRFRMLFAAALVMALNLGFLVSDFAAGPGRGQVSRVPDTLREAVGDRELPDLTRDELKQLSRTLSPLVKRELNSRLPFLVPPAITVLALSLGTALIYLTHPHRVRRRHGARPLMETDAPAIVESLQRDVEKLHIPLPTLEYAPEKGIEGQAFGLRGREALLLYGSPEQLEPFWKPLIRVMALHEIGHIVNRDAQEREKARAVWYALVALLGIALLALLLIAAQDGDRWHRGAGHQPFSFLLHNGWKLAVMLLVVRSIWAGLVRMREFYADWRVAAWGRGQQLANILVGRERTYRPWQQWAWWGAFNEKCQAARWGRWAPNLLGLLWEHGAALWRLHPSRYQRRQVLQHPDRLFRISPELAFVTGLLISLLASNLVFPFQEVWKNLRLLSFVDILSDLETATWQPEAQQPRVMTEMALRQTFVPLFPLAVVGFGIVAFLITSAFGLQAQKESIARLAKGAPRDWGYLALFQPALLIALGTEAGFLIAPFHSIEPIFNRAEIALYWLIGITLLSWLWLAYTRAFARFTLGLHVGKEAPRRQMTLCTLSSTFLLTVLLWPAAFSRLTLQAVDGRSIEEFLYLFASTSIYLSVLALIVYLLWSGASLVGVCLSLFLRRRQCPTCGAGVRGGFTIGAVCDVCERDLAPWSLVDRSAAPLLPEG